MRMVFDHQAEHPSQQAAINLIPGKIGCTGEMLRSLGASFRARLGTASRPYKAGRRLDQGVGTREPRAATGNEILCKASAYFAHAEARSLR